MAFLLLGVALGASVFAYLFLSLRPRKKQHEDNLANALYEQRVAELREDVVAGELREEVAQAAEDDIVRVTLDDDKQLQHREMRDAPTFLSALSVMLLLGGITAAVYLSVGDLDRALGRAVEPQAPMMDETSIRQAVAGLKERLENHPNDAEGWALLGRTMMAMGNYDEAVEALNQANRLIPDAPGLMLQLADAIAMQANGKLTDEAQSLVAAALAIEPNNVSALWLAGLGAAERQDLESAINYLTRARTVSAAAGAPITELDQILAQLKRKAGGDVGSESQAPTVAALPSIPILIEISPEMAKRVTGEESLFVFARVEGQGGPPVAVRRMEAVEFPVRTSLDQSMSMAPQFRLSAGQTIIVAARISPSGQAMPSPGDLTGAAPPFSYPEDAPEETSPINLQIDSVQR
ncbi:MAG: c-type cytochrome biogenesis protein CcmI [Pseudomonadota bacterium]